MMLQLIKKETPWYIKTLLLLVAIFSIASIAVNYMPDSLIEKNVDKSLVVTENEKNHYQTGDAIKNPLKRFFTSDGVDSFTATIMFQESIPGTDIVNISSPWQKENHKFSRFQQAFNNSGYSRYWHGYLVWLKPLLVLFSIKGIWNVLAIVFVILLIASSIAIWKSVSKGLGVLFPIAVCLFSPNSLTHDISMIQMFVMMFVAVILTSNAIKNKKNDKYFQHLFFIIGACSSFFDFLTTPIITIGVPLLLLNFSRKSEDISVKNGFLLTIRDTITWGAGYGISWFAKWIIASLVIGRNVIANGIEMFFHRAGGEEWSRIDAIEKNFGAMNHIVVGITLGLLIISLILMFTANKKMNFAVNLLLLFILLYPVYWFIVLTNHSTLHYWFVHRILLVFEFGVFALFWNNVTSLKMFTKK
jgi:hypothetical protein